MGLQQISCCQRTGAETFLAEAQVTSLLQPCQFIHLLLKLQTALVQNAQQRGSWKPLHRPGLGPCNAITVIT